jgi:hypothetical protein
LIPNRVCDRALTVRAKKHYPNFRFMKWVMCHQGKLQLDGESRSDAVAPGEAWDLWEGREPAPRRRVHELLFDPAAGHTPPMFPALLLARSASDGTTIWCDPERIVYPPALHLAGIPVDRLCLLRPRPADVVWAIGECLQCRGVRAVVGTLPSRLTRAEVRRLQLAAERGNGIGLFLRPVGPGSDIYAAATRWLIAPAPGERDVQRWSVRLVHGHGRHLGQSFLLEKRRGSDQTNLVRLAPPLADRPPVPAPRPVAV